MLRKILTEKTHHNDGYGAEVCSVAAPRMTAQALAEALPTVGHYLPPTHCGGFIGQAEQSLRRERPVVGKLGTHYPSVWGIYTSRTLCVSGLIF